MAVTPLPLPIAALVRRARNATDPTRKHLASYYAWEASIRLTVAAEPPADVSTLGMPSTGHWVKAMPPRPGSLTDPALLALHALLAEVGTDQRQAPKSTNAQKLLALLPAYRNKVIGHGSTRNDTFNQEAARVFLEAIEPAWRAGVFFPTDSVLVCVEKVEIGAGGDRKAHIVRLEGLASEREGEAQAAEDILPGRVYLRKDGHFASLHPWVLFEGGEERERALFFNGYRSAAEYLDYASGDVVKSKALVAVFPSLDADVVALVGGGDKRPPGPSSRKPPAPRPVEGEGEAEEKTAAGEVVAAVSQVKPVVAPKTSRPAWLFPVIGAVALSLGGVGVWLSTKGSSGTNPPAGAVASASVAAAAEERIPQISQDPALQAEFRRGMESLLQADVYGAETALLTVRDKAPREPWPHVGLAMIAALQSHFEDSTRELDEAIRLVRGSTGRDAEFIAILDMSDEDAAKGLAAWETFRAKHPKFFLAHLFVAYYFMYRGTVSEGVARYEAARAIDGRHALTDVLASSLYMEMGKYPEALAEVGKALEMQGASPWILAQRGMVRMRMGDTTAARADLEQAIARRGPFSAHVMYALSLLTTGKSEDEAQFARERQTLLDTKNIDDRLSFMCTHPLVLLREGRAKEADVLIQEAVAFAVDKGEQGTLLRCVLLPSYADVVLGRFEQAEVKFAKLSSVWEGFGLAKTDEERAKIMLKGLKGMLALEKGDLARAETELAELKRLASGGNDELVYAIAVARKEDIVIPDAPEARGNLPRFRRMHLQAHAYEIRGRLPEAERAYERIFDERVKCGKRVFDMHLLCGPYIADGLVRRAELQHKRGAHAEALTTLDAFAAFWPRADVDLSPMKRAAALRKKLPAGK
ncbi:MAG TPA: tetratricopeptide repeat protein [Polyangium sp.]|nr:tetratricopeptide repeat protein [Polyangium sp.]